MKVRELRKRVGLTQEELAKRVGVTRATIIAWESGSEPRVQYLRKLAETLEISLPELWDALQATKQSS